MDKPVTISELLVGANQLFSLPDIYFQLNEMLRDPRFSAADFGKVIAKDPALSARLLRMVNSPFYEFQSKIDTISRAITVVGFDELYNLIIATCVVDQFDKIPCELVDMTSFWVHSVHCAVVARLLAKQSSILQSERLFLIGLLHDIGSLVLYRKMPDKSREVLLAADNDRRLLADFEKEIIGFTHAEVSSQLIKSWDLPESLYEPIAWYLNPDFAMSHQLETNLLHIATQLVNNTERGVPVEQAVNEIAESVLSTVNLTQEQLIAVMQLASSEFLEVFDLVSPSKTVVVQC
jgi:HD-like signal output (HDOD) protein